MSFSNLGLCEELQEVVASLGYTEATPIQQQAIPAVIKGSDVMGGAQTGTGKTAAFALPLIQRLSEQDRKRQRFPQILVMTPTRELTSQVADSFKAYGRNHRVRVASIFGGVKIGGQIDQLKNGVDIVVATPGRLLDHLNQRTIDLSKIEVLVLDEADRMLDMGFIHDIKKIMAQLPPRRQNLLFSATYSPAIKKLADQILRKPEMIEVARRNTAAETVDQSIYKVNRENKLPLLVHLIKESSWYQVLVFSRTKHGAQRLAKKLDKQGIPSAAIHGDKSQAARTKALAQFKKGDVQVLVATDIAARGLDIDQLACVVNFDLPNVPEDYVHRIGRTGRAGSDGRAISLVSPEEAKHLKGIEKLLKTKVPVKPIPDYPDLPQPVQQQGPRQAKPSSSKPARTSSNRRNGARPQGPGNRSGSRAQGSGSRNNSRPQGAGNRSRNSGNNRPSERRVRNAG